MLYPPRGRNLRGGTAAIERRTVVLGSFAAPVAFTGKAPSLLLEAVREPAADRPACASQRYGVPADVCADVSDIVYEPEMVRSVSRDRLVERWGMLDDATLLEILRRVRLLVRDPP